MDYNKFTEIIKEVCKANSDDKYKIYVFTDEDQMYRSDAFNNDFDFRLKSNLSSSTTFLVQYDDGNICYDVGKSTYFFHNKEELMDYKCWHLETVDEKAELRNRCISEIESAREKFEKEYYVITGYTQTSVISGQMSLMDRYKATKTYLEILDEFKKNGLGLFASPMGVCSVSNTEVERLTQDNVDFKYLGMVSNHSVGSEKMCNKMKMGKIDDVYHLYTLGALWIY